MNKRAEERMYRTTGAMVKARKRTNEAYRALAKWVNALALVGSGDDYDGFIARINSMIKHFKDKAMR